MTSLHASKTYRTFCLSVAMVQWMKRSLPRVPAAALNLALFWCRGRLYACAFGAVRYESSKEASKGKAHEPEIVHPVLKITRLAPIVLPLRLILQVGGFYLVREQILLVEKENESRVRKGSIVACVFEELWRWGICYSE